MMDCAKPENEEGQGEQKDVQWCPPTEIDEEMDELLQEVKQEEALRAVADGCEGPCPCDECPMDIIECIPATDLIYYPSMSVNFITLDYDDPNGLELPLFIAAPLVLFLKRLRAQMTRGKENFFEQITGNGPEGFNEDMVIGIVDGIVKTCRNFEDVENIAMCLSAYHLFFVVKRALSLVRPKIFIMSPTLCLQTEETNLFSLAAPFLVTRRAPYGDMSEPWDTLAADYCQVDELLLTVVNNLHVEMYNTLMLQDSICADIARVVFMTLQEALSLLYQKVDQNFVPDYANPCPTIRFVQAHRGQVGRAMCVMSEHIGSVMVHVPMTWKGDVCIRKRVPLEEVEGFSSALIRRMIIHFMTINSKRVFCPRVCYPAIVFHTSRDPNECCCSAVRKDFYPSHISLHPSEC